MGFGDINLGQIASALSMTGSDDDLVEELRRRDEERAMLEPEPEPPISRMDVGDIVIKEREPIGPTVDELPPKAAAALAAYQDLEPRATVSGKRRELAGAPEEVGELGLAATPRFDAEPSAGPAAMMRRQEPEPEPEAPAVANPYDDDPVLPEGTDRALELLGSEYRTQSPQRTPVGRERTSAQSMERLAQNTNEGAALKLQQGELERDEHARAGEAYGAAGVEQDIRTESATMRREEALARKDENIKQAYASLESMRARIGDRPETKGKALQIIGAILSMTPGGGNVGKGMALLGNVMNSDLQEWTANIEGDETMRRAYSQMAQMEDQGINAELNQENAISTLHAARWTNAFNQIAAETKSEEARGVAQGFALDVENKYLQHATDLQQRKELAGAELGQRAALARAKQDEEQGQLQEETSYMRALADVPEESRAFLASKLGPRGVEALKKIQGVEAGQADVAGKRATALKTANEATQGPRTQVAGLIALPGATEQDKAKAEAIETAQNTLDSSLVEMERLQGIADGQANKDYRFHHKLAVGAFNSLANAGVLNPGEAVQWQELLPKHVVDNALTGAKFDVGGAISAIAVDEEKQIKGMRSHFRGLADKNLRGVNYERARPDVQPEGGATAAPGSSQYTPEQIQAEIQRRELTRQRTMAGR